MVQTNAKNELTLDIDALSYGPYGIGRHDGKAVMVPKTAPGDTVVVWRIDRLGRSVLHLAELVADFQARGIGLKSLTEGFDIKTPAGRLMLTMISSMAEFERESIRERVTAGMAAAKRKGVLMGRPKALSATRREHVWELHQAGTPAKRIAELLDVGEATVRRCLRAIRQAQA